MPKKKSEEVEETGQVTEVAGVAVPEVVTAPVEKVEVAATTEVAEVEAAPVAVEKPKKAVKAKAPEAEAVADTPASEVTKIVHKRAEKVGIVASDKMTKTVTVRVDRLVKHPVYRKSVKKRKKFMAHDETGAKIGDKVRIVETRPLSARKRWRVVEIIQKADL